MNAAQASKRVMRKPTRRENGEGCQRTGSERREHRPVPPGYWRWHVDKRERVATREAPPVARHASTGNPRGSAWADGVAERPVVLEKPGNAGGGKGPQVRTGEGKSEGLWEWLGLEPRFSSGALEPPHAKAKGTTVGPRGSEGLWAAAARREPACRRDRQRSGRRGRCATPEVRAAEVVAPFPPRTNRPVYERHGPTGEPVAGKPHGGFGERGEETRPGWRLRHRHDGESRRQQLLPTTYRRRASPRLHIRGRDDHAVCPGETLENSA